jgi:transcriptional regulator of acetoin/glycerol metabolism
MEAEQRAPHGDLVPEIARRLATAHLAYGHPERGLVTAELAIRTGRLADVLEWAAGLRVAGQCQAALGREQEARAALAEAFAVLATTEFNAERERLRTTMADLVHGGYAAAHVSAAGDAVRKPRPAAPQMQRLTLEDGRVFLTGDRTLAESIRLAAADSLPVLMQGETGTGKELVAHLIHELGAKRVTPFVVVDCTTLPEALAEAELFGAARGAYSGSISDRQGLVAAGGAGTLFFDELPVLTHLLQAKLLRLLQHGTFRRVGDTVERRSPARIIAATNRDPEQMVGKGEQSTEEGGARLPGKDIRWHRTSRRSRARSSPQQQRRLERDEGIVRPEPDLQRARKPAKDPGRGRGCSGELA